MSASRPSYGRGAAILSVGIGVTGVVTFGYFALASHTLPEAQYGHITLLWSAVFITVSVLYRPVEQLLSRTIADRDARGIAGNEHLRVAATIQLALGALFVVVVLALRGPIEDELLGGSSALYTILIVAVLAYAASYFARGFLAGHHQFGLYGGLVFMEATSRFMFALAVAVGIAEGQTAVALGIAAAPIVSLSVVPWALRRRLRAQPVVETDEEDVTQFTLARGSGFAVAVLLIARAPLQLFQAVQTSILPHLTRLRASGETDPFRRSVNVTLMAIAAFAGAVALVMLAIGPWLMDVVFGSGFHYERGGLVLVAIAMGLYLSAATLNQALLAHGRAPQACVAWVGCAVTFSLFLLIADFDDRVLQVEIAFVGAAATLCTLLWLLYRRA